MRFWHDLKALYRYREVVLNLASADLKLRYRRSLLGYSWSLLYPLLTLTIMAVVFSQLMKLGDPRNMGETRNYILYVFAGFLPWNFLVNGFWGAGTSLVTNESILRKIYLPKLVFPVSVTCARFLDFLCNMAALFIIGMLLIAFEPSTSLLALPAAVLVLLVFTAGITIALSAITVYVRDTSHLVGVLMQLGFYLTPIIYPLDRIPERLRWYFELNPLTHVIRLFQTILWQGAFPTAHEWAMSSSLAVAALALGYMIFARLERNLIFRL